MALGSPTDGPQDAGPTVSSVIERRQVEEELHRQLLVFETIYDGVVLLSLEGRILDWNAGAERIFGYSKAEAAGQQPDLFWHPSVRGAVEADIRGALDRDGRWTGELPFMRKDGTEGVADVVVVMQHDAQGRPAGILSVNRDITERRALEDRVRVAQRMEAVGQLAGGVAHDFNNLLTVINSHTEFLREGLDVANPLYEDVEAIRAAADRAGSLTRQLLAFSRKQLLQPRPLDLNQVITGLTPMLRRLIGEGIEVIAVHAPDLGRVLADPGQLEQVLMNLAVNARDATPGGGIVRIETANAELDEDYARHNPTVVAGPYVMLAVSDTGCGMDKATQARIFEPFFTTKEAGKGTGLGLATVYGIVKQSGGYIWVYSEPGRGTTFKVYLPRATEVAEAAHSAQTVPFVPKSGSETILLVEDEDAVRKLAQRILERHGYGVLEARNGADALRLATEYGGPIDLVMTDVIMPEMSGPGLIERLGVVRPDVKALFVSGYTDDDIIGRGLLDPDMAFLQKPFTTTALADKVREVLDAPHAGRAVGSR